MDLNFTMYVLSPNFIVYCLKFLEYAISSALFILGSNFFHALGSSAPSFIFRKSFMKYHVPSPFGVVEPLDFAFAAMAAKDLSAMALVFSAVFLTGTDFALAFAITGDGFAIKALAFAFDFANNTVLEGTAFAFAPLDFGTAGGARPELPPEPARTEVAATGDAIGAATGSAPRLGAGCERGIQNL
eukprot:CAMPEP_0194480016 /NCGR_PEP_ID=MMETSP0253-20130528/2958_1 /TAXON_ID=2966 /ORGANISM="Noctiluca scintillans" /LENGTH=185 /DNA_ID=CAMNT_0039319335 /DNA_START=177 /DNA_END=734 /DNA_ORIENTATION=-